jgi:hypothetical protein
VTNEENKGKVADVEGRRLKPSNNAIDAVMDEDEDEVEGHRLLQTVDIDSDDKQTEEDDDVEGHRLHHGHH